VKCWQEAVSFAARKHQHQLRKDGVTPYVAHPIRVMMVLRDVFGIDDEEVLAAAVLHDVIEDTPTDFDEVEENFGPEVARLVSAMSKDMRLRWDVREPAYREAMAQADWKVIAIKLGDVYDNLCDSTPELEKRARRKAERALDYAERHPELADAANALRQLLGPDGP